MINGENFRNKNRAVVLIFVAVGLKIPVEGPSFARKVEFCPFQVGGRSCFLFLFDSTIFMYFKWLQKPPIFYASCEYIYEEILIQMLFKPRSRRKKFCENPRMFYHI